MGRKVDVRLEWHPEGLTTEPAGEVLLYQREDGAPDLAVTLDADTVWLSQQQIAELFQSSRTNVVEHIGHIYDEGELVDDATCRKFRQVRFEGARRVSREVPHYNLDLIISVGYRVRTRTATQFRIWATARLREHLVRGYTLNERRLNEIGTVVQILSRSENVLVSGVADILATYLPGLTLLRDYDEGRLYPDPTTDPVWTLTVAEARRVIDGVARRFPEDRLLGQERGDALEGILAAVYQSFDGLDLYPSIEEKAANLLYLVVKDHPLSDGNKRSAAALFVTFLERNGILRGDDGLPSLTNNALAAITLLVAMSSPREKDLMTALVIRMLSEGVG